MPDMIWAANVLRPLLRFVLLKNSLSVSVPFPCLHLPLALPFMMTQKSGGESRDLILFKICLYRAWCMQLFMVTAPKCNGNISNIQV